MSVTFLSGVVRNRKIVHVGTNFLPSNSALSSSNPPTNTSDINRSSTIPNPTSAPSSSSSGTGSTSPKASGNAVLAYLFTEQMTSGASNTDYDPSLNIFSSWNIFSSLFGICTGLCRNFKLRVHKFTFQWDLVLHFVLGITSLLPFIFTGQRLYAIGPLVVWGCYNLLFVIGVKRANALIPGFKRMKHVFQTSLEEFFSPKLLPILSISFLLVALSLTVTGRRLGGPPLCYSSCSICLSRWDSSIKLDDNVDLTDPEIQARIGCGYVNGKEMLGLYTMAQTSFLQFLTVIVAMSVCMAWRVAEEEMEERHDAVNWLKNEDITAYMMREEMVERFGKPGSAIRPEGNVIWVIFGIIVALTFTLLGWHNWSVLPPSPTATLLIILNLLTILTSTLVLHLGFFGRLLSLYKRNYQRVEFITSRLRNLQIHDMDSWWNFRNHVLNDDLALDYDIGGLAVSATFIINVMVFVTVLIQAYREGFQAIMEPPGSYCAYACLYITMCLLKIFTFATNTFEEQFHHINELQKFSDGMLGKHSSYSSFQDIDSADASYHHSHHNMNINQQQLSSSYHHSNNIMSYPSDDSLMPIGLCVEDADDYFELGNMNMNNSHVSTDMTSSMPPPPPASPPRSSNNKPSLKRGNSLSSNPTTSIPALPPAININTDVPIISSTSPLSSASNTARHHDIESFSPPATPRTRASGKPITSSSSALMTTTTSAMQQATLSTLTSIAGAMRPTTSLLRPSSFYINSNMITDPVGANLASVAGGDKTGSAETTRQTVADMISQIRNYDPYPCILGIPVMPALFNASKFYIFVLFVLIGSRVFLSCLRQVL